MKHPVGLKSSHCVFIFGVSLGVEVVLLLFCNICSKRDSNTSVANPKSPLSSAHSRRMHAGVFASPGGASERRAILEAGDPPPTCPSLQPWLLCPLIHASGGPILCPEFPEPQERQSPAPPPGESQEGGGPKKPSTLFPWAGQASGGLNGGTQAPSARMLAPYHF